MSQIRTPDQRLRVFVSSILVELAAEAAGSVERLGGQDEPLWTGVALMSLGGLETVVGHYDDADRDLTEARELAERFDNDWLAAASRVQLGQLALARGSL
jgi:ATP/maltotriose-dependent transcriptional regulator MalT